MILSIYNGLNDVNEFFLFGKKRASFINKGKINVEYLNEHLITYVCDEPHTYVFLESDDLRTSDYYKVMSSQYVSQNKYKFVAFKDFINDKNISWSGMLNTATAKNYNINLGQYNDPGDLLNPDVTKNNIFNLSGKNVALPPNIDGSLSGNWTGVYGNGFKDPQLLTNEVTDIMNAGEHYSNSGFIKITLTKKQGVQWTGKLKLNCEFAAAAADVYMHYSNPRSRTITFSNNIDATPAKDNSIPPHLFSDYTIEIPNNQNSYSGNGTLFNLKNDNYIIDLTKYDNATDTLNFNFAFTMSTLVNSPNYVTDSHGSFAVVAQMVNAEIIDVLEGEGYDLNDYSFYNILTTRTDNSTIMTNGQIQKEASPYTIFLSFTSKKPVKKIIVNDNPIYSMDYIDENKKTLPQQIASITGNTVLNVVRGGYSPFLPGEDYIFSEVDDETIELTNTNTQNLTTIGGYAALQELDTTAYKATIPGFNPNLQKLFIGYYLGESVEIPPQYQGGTLTMLNLPTPDNAAQSFKLVKDGLPDKILTIMRNASMPFSVDALTTTLASNPFYFSNKVQTFSENQDFTKRQAEQNAILGIGGAVLSKNPMAGLGAIGGLSQSLDSIKIKQKQFYRDLDTEKMTLKNQITATGGNNAEGQIGEPILSWILYNANLEQSKIINYNLQYFGCPANVLLTKNELLTKIKSEELPLNYFAYSTPIIKGTNTDAYNSLIANFLRSGIRVIYNKGAQR